MTKQPIDTPEVKCPVQALLETLCHKSCVASEAIQHLKQAKVEVLLAARTLIDHQIERLQARGVQKPHAHRIKVTEKQEGKQEEE